MDRLITAIRLPAGILAIVIITLFYVFLFVFETITAIASLVYLAIVSGRREVKQSWLTSYPNSLPRIPSKCFKIWQWVFNDDTLVDKNSISTGYLVIGALGVIVIGTIIAVRIISEQSRIQEVVPYTIAIKKVLIEDQKGAEISRNTPNFHLHIAALMKNIDLANCPPDFQIAYKNHILAWEYGDAMAITHTFDEVKRVAKNYYVDTNVLE